MTVELAVQSFLEGRLDRHVGTIYFVQGVDGGPVKIGHTINDPDVRLASMQCDSPVRLRILATCRGSRFDERQFHARFQRCRSHGEWFSPVPEVMAAVAEATPWPRPLIYFGAPRRRSKAAA